MVYYDKTQRRFWPVAEIVFIYSKCVDLVYHVLAYMQVYNDSNLYSEKYIREFERYRRTSEFSFDLRRTTTKIQQYYNQHFERLGIVNFLPLIQPDESFEALKERLLNYPGFMREDKDFFVEPFVTALEKESLIYFLYWESEYRIAHDRRKKCEARLESLLRLCDRVFSHYQKNRAAAFLSFSITCNGRGLQSPDAFFAAVPLPQNERDVEQAFFQLFHEYTHQFTDVLLNRTIRMDDGTHDLSENLVILTDYFIIKKIREEMAKEYLSWISAICGDAGNPFDEAAFLNLFRIPPDLEEMMLKEIRDIP